MKELGDWTEKAAMPIVRVVRLVNEARQVRGRWILCTDPTTPVSRAPCMYEGSLLSLAVDT
jgi:hypothetical protein